MSDKWRDDGLGRILVEPGLTNEGIIVCAEDTIGPCWNLGIINFIMHVRVGDSKGFVSQCKFYEHSTKTSCIAWGTDETAYNRAVEFGSTQKKSLTSHLFKIGVYRN